MRPRARSRGVALALAVILALTACAPRAEDHRPGAEALNGSSAAPSIALADLVPLAQPREYVGSSTAVLPDAEVVPVTNAVEPQLPSHVTSRDLSGDIDQTVTSVERIITLDMAGSLAATVWGLGLGENLVGRDVSTSFPGTQDLPVVTGAGHTVNIEAIIELSPTVVISDGSIGPVEVLTQLRDVGIPVVFVERAPSFEGAAEQAIAVSEALGIPAAGQTLAERISTEVATTRESIQALVPADPADRVRMVFLYLRGGTGVYYLFGEESGADDLIAGLGGIDVANELGWQGMRPLTDEAIIAANPDLILVMTDGLESVGGVAGLLESKPAIALTNAGVNERFVDMADSQVLSFGPRSAQVLEALARAVYAPAS